MLQPDTRRLLTDALRPPSGYHLDTAVATTYCVVVIPASALLEGENRIACLTVGRL